MAALLVEGSPPQMEKGGGGGGVRTRGGIDRSGNKNTTAMANGNNNKMGNTDNNCNLSRDGIWEQPNTETTKVGDSSKIYKTIVAYYSSSLSS